MLNATAVFVALVFGVIPPAIPLLAKDFGVDHAGGRPGVTVSSLSLVLRLCPSGAVAGIAEREASEHFAVTISARLIRPECGPTAGAAARR